MKGLLGAVSLLTRIPIDRADDERLARAVPWFAVVGAGVGLVVAGVYSAAHAVLPALVSSAIAIPAGVLLTGALHEDGLGDVADAFGGGRNRDDRLRILKDPRLGTFGVLAVAASLLIRVSSVAALRPSAALVILPAAHALSRSAAVAALATFPPAAGGLGASYAHGLDGGRAAIGGLSGALIACALLGVAAVPAILIAAAGALILGDLARRRIGGVNGDVLGAIQQVVEICVLVMGAGLFAHGGRTLGVFRF